MQKQYSRRTFIRTGTILGAGLAVSDVLARSAAAFRTDQPFLGEIGIVAFNFAPRGWALCNGQFLPINANNALFALLGTTYGGNGQTTFALPDLRGRVPIHEGNGFVRGEKIGEYAHTLSIWELPVHEHPTWTGSGGGQVTLTVGGEADSMDPTDNYLAANPAWTDRFYPSADDGMGQAQPFLSGALGGSQAHENRMPFLTMNFIIALEGTFPSAT